MSDGPTPLDCLAELACPGGGWGYVPGQPPHLEPTCLALLALSADAARYAAALDAGRAFLRSSTLPDGSVRLSGGRHEAAWPTALALFSLAVLEAPEEELRRTAQVLLALRGGTLDNRGQQDVSDIDGRLIGWPWAEGNFSWVEPTAWACLALRRVGQGEHPRVDEGRKLLLDRTLEQGGINYGNRRIFGISLEPIPTPTALLLLALQGSADDERVRRSVAYLSEHAHASDDVEHLSWAILALDAVGQAFQPDTHQKSQAGKPDLQQRLAQASQTRAELPYLRQAPARLALTALALDVPRRNPFRLPAATARAALPPVRLAAPARPLGERVKGFLQGLTIRATTALRPLEPLAPVHVAPVTDYNADIADVLRRQYEHFRARVPLAGKRVVLKPNLVEYHRDKVINTHPHLVAAVIELCRREGAAEVVVAEGPGHWRNAEYLVAASGLGDVLRHHRVPFVDLNHDEPVKRVNLGRLTGLEHLFLARTVADAEVLISLPKLKTHHWAVATLALKNLFGIVPGVCYGWPKNELHWRGIDNSIVDIALTRTPDLAIVDGIVGMEGDGPLNGTPRAMGVVVMGSDLVAVDATCCRLMQLDPTRVPYLVLANRKKLGILGEAQIEQLGETVAGRAMPFDTVPDFKPLWLGRPA